MSKKKLAAIVLPCVIAVIAVIVISNPRQPTPAGQTYTLITRTSPSGAGAVSPSGGEYQSGVRVTLTASAAGGYRFVSWTGDVRTVADVEDATTTITMNDHYSITASFARELIEIRDWYDLDAVRDNLGGSYLLTNDIDSTTAGYMELASQTADGGKGWKPIGTADDRFTGTLNGQGHEIRDLFINRPGQDYVGLFAYVSWVHPIESVGRIENVVVVNANVTGSYWVGVLVGHNAGIVNNSCATCSVTSGGFYVGGLVGYDDGGFVSDSYSTGNVAGTRYVGGLVGRIEGTRTVREGIVRDCYSTSSVTGGARVGGLVGSTFADVNVSNSYFAGSVSGTRWVGGLVAENYGGNLTNSYSTGNVTGSGYVGGLVAFNLWGNVSNCYSAAVVRGDVPVGGLVGDNSEGIVNNSFWDMENSGQGSSAGGTGKTTAEMKDISTFGGAGWDIVAVGNLSMRDSSSIWNIVDGLDYPFLSWQSVP